MVMSWCLQNRFDGRHTTMLLTGPNDFSTLNFVHPNIDDNDCACFMAVEEESTWLCHVACTKQI